MQVELTAAEIGLINDALCDADELVRDKLDYENDYSAADIARMEDETAARENLRERLGRTLEK